LIQSFKKDIELFFLTYVVFLLIFIISFILFKDPFLNELGDSFGIYNSFFSALSVLLIYESITKQQEEIRQSQQQYSDEKILHLVYRHVDYVNESLQKIKVDSVYDKQINTYIYSLNDIIKKRPFETSSYDELNEKVIVYTQTFVSALGQFQSTLKKYDISLTVISSYSENQNKYLTDKMNYKKLFVMNWRFRVK